MPEVCATFHPQEAEGAGKAGCALHPRSRVQMHIENAHTSIQVQRKHSGLPCAVVYSLYRALPGEPGFFATVTCGSLHKLDTSVGVSGPHDFAVRHPRVRLARASRPPHPTATYLTIAIRPLVWARRANLDH